MDLGNLGEWLAPVGNLTLIGALLASWRLFFTEIRNDRDFWRTIALRGTMLAEKATDKVPDNGT